MNSPRILAIGFANHDAEELRAALDQLDASGAKLGQAADVAEAIEHLTQEAESPPQVVLLAESRPGVCTDRELNQLRGAAPLARIVRLSGVWCEGQLRSGRPPAGSPSHSWHRPLVRLQHELEEPAGPSQLAAPLTATSEDLLLATRRRKIQWRPTRRPQKRIAIHAPRTSQADAWAALCEGCGYDVQVCTSRPGTKGTGGAPVDAVLWDCDPRDLSDRERVRGFLALAAGVPLIAACGFPRPRDVQSALEHGVAAVLAKPVAAADFEWLFSRLFGPCSAG